MGKIAHIWAADRPKGRFRDLDYEWGAVGKGGMELFEAPGDHATMFQGENARTLGRILNACLIEMDRDAMFGRIFRSGEMLAPSESRRPPGSESGMDERPESTDATALGSR